MFSAYSVEAQTPWVHSYALIVNSTRNSRRNKIISHFRPCTGPVQSRVARCILVRLIVTPVSCGGLQQPAVTGWTAS